MKLDELIREHNARLEDGLDPVVCAPRWLEAAANRPRVPPPTRRALTWVEVLAYGSLMASLVLLASMVVRTWRF
jgi:hypothetical protein